MKWEEFSFTKINIGDDNRACLCVKVWVQWKRDTISNYRVYLTLSF